MIPFPYDVFWTAAEAVGMLKEASTILPGCTEPKGFLVRFRQPDFNPLAGVRSRDFEIEFQYHDVPTLKEAAEVIVDGVLYRVREDPFIDAERDSSGYFRTALLTRIGTAIAP